MTLTVNRDQAVGFGQCGQMQVGDWGCYTLERLSTLIPLGSYQVLLTVSQRATEGELWTPDPTFRLPLIVVPGRSGIRIHAANHPSELEGCIAVGQVRSGDTLGHSRVALTQLWALLTATPDTDISIDVQDPPPVE